MTVSTCRKRKNACPRTPENFNSLDELELNLILTNIAENSFSFSLRIPQILFSNKHFQVKSYVLNTT